MRRRAPECCVRGRARRTWGTRRWCCVPGNRPSRGHLRSAGLRGTRFPTTGGHRLTKASRSLLTLLRPQAGQRHSGLVFGSRKPQGGPSSMDRLHAAPASERVRARGCVRSCLDEAWAQQEPEANVWSPSRKAAAKGDVPHSEKSDHRRCRDRRGTGVTRPGSARPWRCG